MDRTERLYRIDALLHEHAVVLGPNRSGFSGDQSHWAGVESRGQHVIKPDAGQIQVLRLWAGRWRIRPDQGVGRATIVRTLAAASVVLSARTQR